MTDIAELYEIHPDHIYTTYQVANIFGVKRWTIIKVIRNGELKAKKFGNGYRVLGRQILDFLHREFE